MRKRVFGRNLGRSYTAKKALTRSLVKDIVGSGDIVTTKAKAKFFLPELERMINLAGKGGVAERRAIYAKLANDRDTTDRLFEIAKTLKAVRGGYFKVVNLPSRRGDRASTVKISWSQKFEKTEKSKKAASKSGKKSETKETKDKSTSAKSLKGRLAKLRKRTAKSKK